MERLNRFAVVLGILVVGLMMISVMVMPGIAVAAPKVEVCHFPPGNPDNFHTIRISANALSAHLAHGDPDGACNAVCAQICDDGDACTIDDTDDCEQLGCPSGVRDPVDCGDGMSCTTDSCDSATGCSNDPIVCTPSDVCHVSACAEPEGTCIETPVVCPEGETCNPSNGACEPTFTCPCEGETAGFLTWGPVEVGSCIDNPIQILIRPKDDLQSQFQYVRSLSESRCSISDPDGPLPTAIIVSPLSEDELDACEESLRQIIAGDGAACSP